MLDYKVNNSLDVKEKFKDDFKYYLKKVKEKKDYNKIVFFCVGTDRITGDCFGPIVGSNLTEKLKQKGYNIKVYGSLKENLNYKIIERLKNDINENVCNIVIDSALSKKENIGKIYVSNKKMMLGKSLDKSKIELGDISIKAVVGKDYKISKYNLETLKNVSLNSVIVLANVVTDGIYENIENLYV